MRKNKILLPLVGAFLMCVSGCDIGGIKDSHIITDCDHSYSYKVVNDKYHNQVCDKCGEPKVDSKEKHDFDPDTHFCKLCSYEENGVVTCEKHTWGEKEVLKEATCTENGESQRTCIVCGTKEEPKVLKAIGHNYVVDEAASRPATCTESGYKEQTCSRCGDKINVEVAALGHNWVDDEGTSTTATCTQPGVKYQHCSRCNAVQEVVVDAFGHDFGDWTPVEGLEPTCEASGAEKRICRICYNEEIREVGPLGHNFKIISPDVVTSSIVRVYACERCWETVLGFKATDVTDESKTHLVVDQDGGVSFWGRPIGNAMRLDADGCSINQLNNECVYCSTETGDFFEYVFDLTAEQADLLSTCRLYCDAKPANYLSGDFWAYGNYSDDWTPGYYIDGSDEHIEHNEDGTPKMVKDHARAVGDAAGDEIEDEVPMGKRITDYRYILYVDGQVKDFDPSISVPVEGRNTNMVRKEYLMPYTFKLHEGENRIRLCMAGGYRSTFYNFTFRPYVEPKISFSANDVTDASKQHLKYDLDGGASYKGRPIGNAMRLDADGYSINQLDDEIVYCSAETGDYFEYKFNLSAEQAQNFRSCRLYCDAKPANYLSGDFWAYTYGGDHEWTPGYYIDGTEDHIQYNEDGTPKMVKDHAKAVGDAEGVELDSYVAMGKRVSDYRYVLYVDGEVKEFDSSINVPVEGSGINPVRKEYVMPYTFNLHEGENTIRLHMAGGYRSTFYNFTFRPC